MSGEPKRICIFCRNDDSGEPAYYCGHTDAPLALQRGIGHIVLGEVRNIPHEKDSVSLVFEVKELTDAEIAALPDV